MKLQDIDYYVRGFTAEGIRVFPLMPRSKDPATAHGFKDATLDPMQYEDAFERGCNLAIATGGAVDVIDCDSVGCAVEFARRVSGGDISTPEEAADALEAALGPVVWTGRGAHVFVLADEARRCGAKLMHLADGDIDYRGHGGYVVAPPSVHPSGAIYRFHSGYFTPKAKAPEWLPVSRREEKAPMPHLPLPLDGPPSAMPPTPDAYFERVLDANIRTLEAAEEGCRNNTLNTVAFNIGQVVSTDSQKERASAALYETARAIGLEHHESVQSIKSGMEGGAAKPKRPQPEPQVQFNISANYAERTKDRTIEAKMEMTAQKRQRLSLPEIVDQIDTNYGDLLGFNLFSSQVVKLRDQDNEPESRHGLTRWEDIDASILAMNISSAVGRDLPAETLAQAVSISAHRHEMHPVRDYLRQCRARWDGQSRIRAMLRALGAAETKAHRLELALWLAGAAARGMSDGPVKLDSMLILEGPQGTGKSTVVKILGGEWSMDTPLDLDQMRESYMQLAGVWIAEWPELSSFVKTTPEKLKAFLSKEYDDFRAPWGRNVTRQVRHCAFIGTTNDDMYLRDDTGNRRFWPIRCGSTYFNLEWLRKERDQLWGEAVELCDAYTRRGTGFAAAPGTEAEVLAAQVQTRQQIDELADMLVQTVRERFEKQWSTADGVFVTLDELKLKPEYANYRKPTLKRTMETIGGQWCRRQTEQTIDFSSGKAVTVPASKERLRGCLFKTRPNYAADYNDKDFGEVLIPTE